jgi:hypothetical protein
METDFANQLKRLAELLAGAMAEAGDAKSRLVAAETKLRSLEQTLSAAQAHMHAMEQSASDTAQALLLARKQLGESEARAQKQSQKLVALEKELAVLPADRVTETAINIAEARMAANLNVLRDGNAQELLEGGKASLARSRSAPGSASKANMDTNTDTLARIPSDLIPDSVSKANPDTSFSPKVATDVDVGERGKKGWLMKRSNWIRTYQSVWPLLLPDARPIPSPLSPPTEGSFSIPCCYKIGTSWSRWAAKGRGRSCTISTIQRIRGRIVSYSHHATRDTMLQRHRGSTDPLPWVRLCARPTEEQVP